MTCDACSATDEPKHDTNCIAAYSKDGSCLCKKEKIELKKLEFHGRKMMLCEECYDKEIALLRTGSMKLHEYQKNVPDKIEYRLNEFTKTNFTVAKWQEVYTTERPNWVVEKFESVDEMREQLLQFIISMEQLSWEAQTKKRAAFDAAKELDARMSKEDRDKLINDPNFKPTTNSEFKKLSEERLLDEAIKTIGMKTVTAQQRKSIKKLLDFGLSVEEIKNTLKLV